MSLHDASRRAALRTFLVVALSVIVLVAGGLDFRRIWVPIGQFGYQLDGNDVVVYVADGSPASKAGILVGDIVENERRQIDVAGGGGMLGEAGHVNFVEPAKFSEGDLCGSGLVGSPCLTFTLPGGAELIANFGKDNGMADWALSEVVLGNRDLLVASGRVIANS